MPTGGDPLTNNLVTGCQLEAHGLVWAALRGALRIGDAGSAVDVRRATGVVESVGERHALVRLTDPVPGMLSVGVHDAGGGATSASVRAHLFSPDAAAYARREQPAWRDWLQGVGVRA